MFQRPKRGAGVTRDVRYDPIGDTEDRGNFMERGRWMFASSARKKIAIVNMLMVWGVVRTMMVWKRVNGIPVLAAACSREPAFRSWWNLVY